MPAVTRVTDICSGHGCFPPRHAVSGSTNVFVNGLGVVRKDDPWETHCCTIICHDGVSKTVSSKVFVNGKGVTRIGDEISCGSVSAQGSHNVFFG
jgi:uncharacterized Zn-binding protein involved in type VI secretion